MSVLRGDKLVCSVGVTAYNEEGNIGNLLAALVDQHLHSVEITEIIVVASACTDRTVPIIQEYMQRDPRIKLIEQEKREGKTSAVNIFLKMAQSDICVLESGDTIPHEYAVEHLVRMFKDPEVGMVGAQKVAVNTPDHIIGLLSHLRLRMEHELCLEIPRLGEMIAFRKLFDHIPHDVAMDEAFVESLAVKHGLSVQYAPDAVVYNTGPTTITDFVRQRRRNHAGHLYLKHKYGYAVSSIQNRRVARVAFKELWGVIRLVWVLFLLAVLEGWSRLLGWYDYAIKRDRHVVWNMAWTQKQDVQSIRLDAQAQKESFAVSPQDAIRIIDCVQVSLYDAIWNNYAMTTLQKVQELLPEMTPAEKAQVLQWIARDLGGAFPGIESTPGVAGGEPCIVRTRIPVWVLVQARKLGSSEADILKNYPTLTARHLTNAWAYYRYHKKELEQQIIENEMA